MNRITTVKQGENGLFIFALCPHCKEPQGIIAYPDKKQDVSKCFCRGADGLSFNIKCCYVLNCIKKNGHVCNLLEAKEKEYPPGKWNVIVTDIPRTQDE